jgi:hypothetical protein
MDGRLAPYLARNQSLYHEVPRAIRDSDGRPLQWKPSLGTPIWTWLRASIASLRARQPTPAGAGETVPAPAGGTVQIGG